jgi:hypothetical protein
MLALGWSPLERESRAMGTGLRWSARRQGRTREDQDGMGWDAPRVETSAR